MRALPKKPIKDYCIGIYDGPHATPKETDDGPIFLGIKNITADGRLDLTDIRHVSEEEFPKWTRRVTPKAGDVVLTYEATLHRYALIPGEFRGCLGRRVALVRPDPSKVNSQYLLYYFLSFEWRRIVESAVINGATVDRLPLEKLPSFPVRLPELHQQIKVADILSCYDDLIENNKRRIELLEQSARLLYREWFVRLKYPGHEHDKLVDGLPQGWSRKLIVEVADTIGGGTPSTSSPQFWDEGSITWFVPSDLTNCNSLVLLDSERKITEAGLKESSARILPQGSILMTSRASIGFFGIYDEGECCTNQGFISVFPKIDYARMYMLHNLIERKQEIVGLAGGTTFKEINKTTFRNMRIVIPREDLRRQFEEFCSPVFKMVRVLRREIKAATVARDLLLPRLVDGRISV